jgi:DNA-binding MarR family transcriptional regulator
VFEQKLREVKARGSRVESVGAATETQTEWLDAAELEAWRSFLGTHARLIAVIDRELIERHELSLAEYEVMVHLAEAPNRQLRMRDLAELCSLSPSGLTRRFDSMAREGFVARRKCYSDRRGVYAELSPLGFERFVAATPTYVEVVRRAFVRPLERDGQGLLTELLGRLSVDDSAR